MKTKEMIEARIALLEARKKDNGKIIKKLQRELKRAYV